MEYDNQKFPPLICPITVNPVQFAAAASSGLLEFDFVLTTSGTNQNGQTFLDEDLRQPEIYNYVINQPIDCDHLPGFRDVRGEIRSAVYCAATASMPSCIRCKGVIFEYIGGHFQEVAELVRMGAGKWAAVSMEAVPRPLRKINGGPKVIIHNPLFIGAGLVRRPGNILSQIENLEGKTVPQFIQPTDRTPDHRLVAENHEVRSVMQRADKTPGWPTLQHAGTGYDVAIPIKRLTGVSVVAVIYNNTHILLGKRRDNGKWTNPGGHLDPGEAAIDGARRELREETGIDATTSDLHVLASEDIVSADAQHLRIFAYRLDVNEHVAAKVGQDPDKEVQKWQWIPLDNVPPPAELHAPKNVILKALGVQKTEYRSLSTAREVISEGMRLLTSKRSSL